MVKRFLRVVVPNHNDLVIFGIVPTKCWKRKKRLNCRRHVVVVVVVAAALLEDSAVNYPSKVPWEVGGD